MNEKIEYVKAGFPLLDRIRLLKEGRINEILKGFDAETDFFEPVAGDDDGLYGNNGASHGNGFFDLKLTTDGDLAVINSGYYGDINEVVGKIPVVPTNIEFRDDITQSLVYLFSNIDEEEAKNVDIDKEIAEMISFVLENS